MRWTPALAAVLAIIGCHEELLPPTDTCATRMLVGEFASPPCEGEPAEACRTGSITVGGVERCYVYTVPETSPVSLIIAWHGRDQNGASFRLTMNDTFDDLDLEGTASGDALIVYPDALPNSECGGVGCWFKEVDGPGVALFDALRDELTREWDIDPANVFSIGYSHGGRFVEVLACHRGNAHRAVASIAAGANNVSSCPGSTPIWITHGVDDRVVSYGDGTSNLDAWADRNGCDAPAAEGSYPRDSCTDLNGCAQAVTWCPTTETDWEGHAPPALADDALWSFFMARLLDG